MTERDESAEHAAPPTELLEAAARSLASGASLASVAGWFNVPEAQLTKWIAGYVDQPAPPESVPVKPAAPTRRPAAARPAPTIHTPAPAFDGGRRQGNPSPKSLRDSLGALRRRILVVVIGLVVGGAAGWFTAPGEAGGVTTYQATHTLIYEARGGQGYNIEQAALLATTGEVPSRVAARLKLDRSQVRSGVSAEAKSEVATISITGRSDSPDGAVALADVTAEELEAEIVGGGRATADAELGRLQGQLDAARNHFNAIPPKNTAERAATQADVQAAERALQQYQASASKTPTSELRTLEKASATTVRPAGVQAPNSKPGRAFLLGLVGLLAGIVGAFRFDRLDSRIRSKAAAEEAFGAPVVAEVPRIPKASQGEMLALTDPSSPFVEAHRGLRTYVALWAPEADREDGHRVIVVTSPSPSEGKTTTVAHLAAMLAELGRSVVVISADLRRPRLHQFFDLPAGPGLTEALAIQYGPPVFSGLDRPTSIRGVRLVPSGPAVENPAQLFEHAEDLVLAVRPLADFVLIDAPPLLVANDAVEMARHADGVLLVARSGKTPLEGAQRCAETLARLEIPVVGTVLVGSEAASNASRYYASRYYTEPDRTSLRRRRSAADGQPAGPELRRSRPEEVSGSSGRR
jgi:capsular exopolysaccharide synthesis family protein